MLDHVNASSKYNWYVDIRNEIRHRLVATKDSSKQVILIDESGHEYMYLGFVDSSIYARPLLAQLHYFYSALSERVLVIHEFS
ncbi:hypothetical protein OLMES_0460 [Oleiphilus messinensis]|uniref:Uncharacterized protein n=1 Tax=Oleiphilus messinensis TaxID=141451 RepID=A0A1Y0I536_9GAMM|nr:hypothetical protein OLMES_0460 [Oleiphilus messinensis]